MVSAKLRSTDAGPRQLRSIAPDNRGMARAPRHIVVGAPHHITLRGNNRRKLFSYPRDYRLFLRLLEKSLVRSPVQLHALCLMSNHVHLLATPDDESALAAFVKHFSQRYAQARNKKYRATGKLFEERYFSKPALSESSVAVVTAYIDLNPVRAGIHDDPAQYPWSGARLHLGLGGGEIRHQIWTPTDWYVRLGKSANLRARAYARWLHECGERDTELSASDSTKSTAMTPIRPNRSRAAG